MIDLIQRLHISWFHAQHLRMIETFSFLWWKDDHHLHQAHFQFLRVYLKSLRVYLMSHRNLHVQHRLSQHLRGNCGGMLYKHTTSEELLRGEVGVCVFC